MLQSQKSSGQSHMAPSHGFRCSSWSWRANPAPPKGQCRPQGREEWRQSMEEGTERGQGGHTEGTQGHGHRPCKGHMRGQLSTTPREEKLRITGTKWALPPPSGGKGWSQAPWQTRGGAGAIRFPSWAPLGRGSRLHGLITSLPLIQRRVSHSLAGARFGSQAQPGEFPAF